MLGEGNLIDGEWAQDRGQLKVAKLTTRLIGEHDGNWHRRRINAPNRRENNYSLNYFSSSPPFPRQTNPEDILSSSLLPSHLPFILFLSSDTSYCQNKHNLNKQIHEKLRLGVKLIYKPKYFRRETFSRNTQKISCCEWGETYTSLYTAQDVVI